MSTELNTSLKALQKTYGQKALLAAMAELTSKRSATPKDPDAAPKGEHLKEWRALIASVREEMIAANWTHPESGKPASYRDAMAEASLRKNADASPEELAKKAAAKAKAAATKAAKKAGGEATSDSGSVKKAGRPKKAAGGAGDASSDTASVTTSVKKAGRPKMTDEQKAAAKAKREAAKATDSDSGSVKKAGKKAASDEAAAASDGSSAKKAGRPKMTEEQKAAAKAKREAAKVAESEALEATPVEIDGKPCVTIMGGYAYEYENEEVGAYLGFLKANGKLDKKRPQPTGPE
jgi:hypothetical protein